MPLKIFGLMMILIGFAFAQSVEDIVEEVQEKYEGMQNFSAEFVQAEYFKITGSRNETSGKIYVKNGVQYRLQTEDRTIATDGITVWTYSVFNNQVLIDRAKKDDGAMLPRDLLFKYPHDYYASLLEAVKIGGADYYIIKLDPKEETHGYIKTMKIWVKDKEYLISKIEYTDFNNNVSTFEISKVDIKKNLPDSMFQFTPPEGAEVVDLRM